MGSHWLSIESNIVGLVGVTIILYAYFMLQLGRMYKNIVLFSALNIIGSFFILFSLYFNWNLPSVIIEISWLVISIFGLIRGIVTQKEKKQKHS